MMFKIVTECRLSSISVMLLASRRRGRTEEKLGKVKSEGEGRRTRSESGRMSRCWTRTKSAEVKRKTLS